MSERYTLIIDDDEVFRRRLRAIVQPAGHQLVVAHGEDEALDQLMRLSPQAVFIAVDLPHKEGFVQFSKVKKRRRMVPVFLTTSSVSRTDLKLHEKLKVHADAYWDKREVTDDEIRRVLGARIGLQLEEQAGSESLPRQPASPPVPTTEPWLAELIDPETASILEEIDQNGIDAVASAPDEAPGANPSAVGIVELEDTIRRLRQELEHARHDARSSPFSSDFSRLREVASRKDQQIRNLEATLSRREAQLVVVKSKLTDIARRLFEIQRSGEAAGRERAELEETLDAVRSKLKRADDASREQKNQDEQALLRLREQLAAERTAFAAARREREGELSELRAAHEEALKAAQARHLAREAELAAHHLESNLRQVDELESKYTARLGQAQAAHDRALETTRLEQRKEMESLHARYLAASEKSAAEAQEALQQAAAKYASLLDHANEQRLQELKRADDRRVSELHEAETRHQGETDALVREHVAETQQFEQQLHSVRMASEASTAELTVKVQDLEGRLTEEKTRYEETRERYEREVAELQSGHTKHLEQAEQDQFSALAGLSKKFREERDRFVEAERRRSEERVERLQREHKELVDALHGRHEEQVSLLQAAHENEIGRQRSDQDHLIRLAAENARAELQEVIDRAARKHADEIAALRKEQERDNSSARSAHLEALRRRDRENQESLSQALGKARDDAMLRLAEARREASDGQAELRREYEGEVAALERIHQETLSKRDREAREALALAEKQREEALLRVDELRAENEELRAKHRSALALADEEHKTALLELQREARQQVTRVEEENHFLNVSIEKLKRQSEKELTRSLGAIAQEKKLHQATRDRYEHRIAELKVGHEEGAKQVESSWMRKFEALEKGLVARKNDAATKSEAEWKAKLDRERIQNEEAVKALTNDFTIELATLRRQVERNRALEESYRAAANEITSLQARMGAASEQLTEARMTLAEREHELEVHRKKLSETTGTIDSLKAVIDDFSRSVEGIDRERRESDGTIDSLKAVIDDFYRSVASRPTN